MGTMNASLGTQGGSYCLATYPVLNLLSDRQWYRYDDETVTPLGAYCILGDRKGTPQSTTTVPKPNENKKKGNKRKRLETLPEERVSRTSVIVDDEVEILDPSAVKQSLFDEKVISVGSEYAWCILCNSLFKSP